MADPATPSRLAKRQHTETIDLTPNSGDSIAALESGKTHTVPARTQTLPANFNGDLSTLPDFNLNAQELPSSLIFRLPAAVTKSLLAYAAARDPYIHSLLAHQFSFQIARKHALATKFSHYSQIADNLLNIKCVSFRSPKTFEVAFDAVSDISEMVDDILDTVKKDGGYDCSYGTRKKAVKTIADIMTTMVMASPELRHQARNYVYEATEMEKKLLEMMKYFDGNELAQLDRKGWTDKVRELQFADRYFMYKRLHEVVAMLEGASEESEEDSEEYDEDDEEAE